MTSLPTVAFAGATGNLGPAVLKELLDAGFQVTVLSRQAKSASSLPAHERLTIKEVDYDSPESLASALTGIEAVVSALSLPAVDVQKRLMDAAVAAGVHRFIPSDFGSDTLNPNSAKLPVFGSKIAALEYLKEKIQSSPDLSYTIIMNNAFWDWGIDLGFVINAKEHTATLYNGGDVPFSVTRLSTIGRAVVGVLKNLDATANRAIYVHDAVVTQNQLIDSVKKLDGKEWKTTMADVDELVKQSYAELKKENGNVTQAMYGFIFQAIFGKGYGGDFTGRVDNKLLGIKELDEQEVAEVMKEIVQGRA